MHIHNQNNTNTKNNKRFSFIFAKSVIIHAWRINKTDITYEQKLDFSVFFEGGNRGLNMDVYNKNGCGITKYHGKPHLLLSFLQLVKMCFRGCVCVFYECGVCVCVWFGMIFRMSYIKPWSVVFSTTTICIHCIYISISFMFGAGNIFPPGFEDNFTFDSKRIYSIWMQKINR